MMKSDEEHIVEVFIIQFRNC